MAGVFDLIRWPSPQREPPAIPRVDLMSLEVLEAKVILAEVFNVKPEEVNEMIKARITEIATRVQSMS
jgi:hypothetical protein